MKQRISYILAALVITAALLVVSVTYVFTPLLNTHKVEFETWASRLLRTPIKVESVQLSWYQYQPEISLNQVNIQDQHQLSLLQIKKIRVSFSLLKSVWYRQFVPNRIILSGAAIQLNQNEAGDITLEGFSPLNTRDQASENPFTDIMGWLVLQPRINLEDIDLQFTPYRKEKLTFKIEQLNFANAALDHWIYAKAKLLQTLPTDLTLSTKWHGDQFDLNKINANLYFYVTGLSLSQWFAGKEFKGQQIKNGILSAKVWASWQAGQFERVQSTLQAYNLDLLLKAKDTLFNPRLNRLSGSFAWKHENNKYIFAGDDVLVDLPQRHWPLTHFYLTTNEEFAPQNLNIGYLDIKEILSILVLLPPELFDKQWHNIISEIKPSGSLQNLSVVWKNKENSLQEIQLATQFLELKTSPWKNFPGVSNLSGSLNWDGLAGNIILRSIRSIFNAPHFFQEPVRIDQLTGDVNFKNENDEWFVVIKDLEALSSNLALNTKGNIKFSQNNSPFVDFITHFSVPNASRISPYLPLKLFDPDFAEWLQSAFNGGEIPEASIVIKGPLAQFPFENGTGTFSAIAKIRNIDLNYAPEWPELSKADATLTFAGSRMEVEVAKAEIFDIPLNKIKGIIPQLTGDQPAILEISADQINTDFTTALKFIHHSPLADNLGQMFNDAEINGKTVLNLGLKIPLKKPEDTQVQGKLFFDNAKLNLVPWELELTQLNGNLQFTEHSTTADLIHAKLFGETLTFSLNTQKKQNQSVITADINSKIDMKNVEKWLKVPVQQVAQGLTDFKAQLNLAFNKSIELILESNLQGIQLTLPDPYKKMGEVVKPIKLLFTMAEAQPLKLKVFYDQLSAALFLNKHKDQFNILAATINLSPEDPAWPPSAGLFITGNLPEINWEMIKKYRDLNTNNNMQFSALTLKSINIKTKLLEILGQRFTDVQLQLKRLNDWSINIIAKDITGRLSIPMVFNRSAKMSAYFDKLYLRSTKSTTPAQKLQINSLPSLILDIKNLQYDNMNLGHLSLQALSTATGIQIPALAMSSPYYQLESSGDWKTGSNMTHLQGDLKSSNVTNLLKSFGLSADNLVSSKGIFNFNLNWSGAPYDLNLASLQGTAKLELGKGSIINIEGTSGAKMDLGRMLNLFSLQSLPRRLTGDFSDIFQKGYVFDSLKGNMTFDKGSAYTTNLYFDGAVARVGIDGRIGLVNKDFDMKLSVSPYVTSSLPLAATLLTGPVIGLATLAANKVLSSAISQVTTYTYLVTGPWDNPKMDSLNTQKQK